MPKNTQCYMCKNYDRYYTKCATRYEKTGIGFCRVKRETTGIRDSCEKFSIMPKTYTFGRLVHVRLSDLLTELSEIRKILEEENGGEEL